MLQYILYAKQAPAPAIYESILLCFTVVFCYFNDCNVSRASLMLLHVCQSIYVACVSVTGGSANRKAARFMIDVWGGGKCLPPFALITKKRLVMQKVDCFSNLSCQHSLKNLILSIS